MELASTLYSELCEEFFLQTDMSYNKMYYFILILILIIVIIFTLRKAEKEQHFNSGDTSNYYVILIMHTTICEDADKTCTLMRIYAIFMNMQKTQLIM